MNPTLTAEATGVAIYFMSPLWPYLVNTAVSLDSGPTDLIDLTDHSRPENPGGNGSETVKSQVVWGVTGLTKSQHTLLISVGAGQPYAIVDALMWVHSPSTMITSYFLSYTALDPGDLATTADSITSTPVTITVAITQTLVSSTTASTAGATTSSAGGASSTTSGSSSSSNSKLVLPIALGVGLGMLGLSIIGITIWFCSRRRDKRPPSEAWLRSNSHAGSPQMSNSFTTSPRSTAYENPAYPAYYLPADGQGVERQYGDMNPHTAAHLPAPRPQVSNASFGSQGRNVAMPNNNANQGYNPWTAEPLRHAQFPPHPQVESVRHSGAFPSVPSQQSSSTQLSTAQTSGGLLLSNSPASRQTDLYYDIDEGGSDRRTSPPTSIVAGSRPGPSTYPTQQPYQDPMDAALRLQESLVTKANIKDPPAYTAEP